MWRGVRGPKLHRVYPEILRPRRDGRAGRHRGWSRVDATAVPTHQMTPHPENATNRREPVGMIYLRTTVAIDRVPRARSRMRWFRRSNNRRAEITAATDRVIGLALTRRCRRQRHGGPRHH